MLRRRRGGGTLTRNQNKRINFLCINNSVIALANSVDCFRGFKGCKRCKQNIAVAVNIRRAYIVLCVLKAAADAFFGVFIEVAVKL
jgi:hypothetical protein